MITQQRLHELLDYDPATGVFTRKVALSNSVKCGAVAGAKTQNGKKCTYTKMFVDGRKYYAHRLAWLYVYGVMPSRIDHIDLDGTNNAIDNLRLADRTNNAANTEIRSDNTTGYKGVSKTSDGKKYRAQITFKQQQYHLGVFSDPTAAHDAYVKAAKDFFEEFARAS